MAGPRALRVVALGGGTGLSTLLRGLRRHVMAPGSDPGLAQIADLAAVVTVTDDGGSSGRLRRGFNMLPPGDLRNCMVALSEEEDLLVKLFSHRFRGGGDLKGHNLGNLFVAALTEVTGDFALAIQLASKILATRGSIYPVTTSSTTLVAHMDDGPTVRGETKITASKRRIVELTLDPPDPVPLPETLHAIRQADLITVGPGSLYTSLITNLLVQGGFGAGQRARIAGLHLQSDDPGQREPGPHRLRAHRAHLRPYARTHLRLRHRQHRSFSPETLKRYAAEGAAPIVPDIEKIEALGVRCIAGDFASEENVVRHAAGKLAGALLALGQTVPFRSDARPGLRNLS